MERQIKYGRTFKLSNGETEYIEISGEAESYNIESKMEALKRQVDSIHAETEYGITGERSPWKQY